MAFKRQHPALMANLKSNVIELAQIALGVSPVTSSSVISTAFYCLTNTAPVFTSQLPSNRQFLQTLFSQLTQPTEYGLLAFARIFQFTVEQSNGFVFVNITDRPDLLARLIQLLTYNSIFELMTSLTSGIPRPVMHFLENGRLTTLLLNALADDIIVNCRILQLMSFLFTKNLPSQPLMRVLAEDDNLNKLFNFAINSKNDQFSALSSKVLLNISDIDFDFSPVILKFLRDRMIPLCNFAFQSQQYTAAASGAVRLVIRLMKDFRGEISESAVKLATFLFDLIFLFPGNTVLHQDCLLLFASLHCKSEVVRRARMTERIPAAFMKYHETIAVYWACLHTMARLILETKVSFDETDAWKTYIVNHFQRMETIMRTEYGGALGQSSDSSEMSTEYEYDDYEEDDEYDDYDDEA
jgi:hypothetical protein